MIRFNTLVVWLVALIVAGYSCASTTRELSSYWDGHDFSSLESFDDIDAAEDKFNGYIDLLSRVPHKTAVDNLTEFLDSASRNVVAYMVWSGWFEPYLHALESPYRNDALFVAWLDKVLEDDVIDDGAMMEHLQRMRLMMDKNTAGSSPQDLALCGEDGEDFMISDLYGEYMLMLFVDADCPSCLNALAANAKEYEGRNVRLLAVLVNGSKYHMENIRRQLPDSVLSPWTLACVSARKLEQDGLYDKSLLPFRILVNADGMIEKSYH